MSALLPTVSSRPCPCRPCAECKEKSSPRSSSFGRAIVFTFTLTPAVSSTPPTNLAYIKTAMMRFAPLSLKTTCFFAPLRTNLFEKRTTGGPHPRGAVPKIRCARHLSAAIGDRWNLAGGAEVQGRDPCATSRRKTCVQSQFSRPRPPL